MHLNQVKLCRNICQCRYRLEAVQTFEQSSAKLPARGMLAHTGVLWDYYLTESGSKPFKEAYNPHRTVLDL